jgi:hypothetical protein
MRASKSQQKRDVERWEKLPWSYLPWSDPVVNIVPAEGLAPVYTLQGTYEEVERAFKKAILGWYDTHLMTTHGYSIHLGWAGEARLRRGHKVYILDITVRGVKHPYHMLDAYVWQAHHSSPMIGFASSQTIGIDLIWKPRSTRQR